jgi:hypothetical protein
MTAEQLHLSPLGVQVVFQPSGLKASAAFSQVTATPETLRQSLPSDTFAEPVAVVLSMYVPSALAVKVPVVVSVPVTGTLGQPRLKYQPSMSPAKPKQEDDETVQVPTTEPPHGATSGQDGPAPLVPPVPPPDPELVQAEAKVRTVAKSPTPRNPRSACLIGPVLSQLTAFSSRFGLGWHPRVLACRGAIC